LLPSFFAIPYTEFYNQHDSIPTVDDLLKVWDLCDQDLEEDGPEQQKMKALVIWYYDKWLPMVAGQKYWGDKMRLNFKHIPSDKVKIYGEEEKVLIPITTEAFGILVLDNCYDRWINTCEWKKDDPKRRVPKKGAESVQFGAKYTDSKVGQVKFGGWTPDAYTKFAEYIQKVQENRQADEANGWNRQKYARKLVLKEYNNGEDTATQAAAAAAAKRKAPPAKLPESQKLKRLKE
jgi:hypothetical protein